MRVTVLASGSAGNSVLVEAARTRLLIDAGLKPEELRRRIELAASTTRLEDIKAVCVTHEHRDHVSGVLALASAGMSVYATAGTARQGRLSGVHEISAGTATCIDELEIMPVALPHDASQPVGFVLSDGLTRTGILTDCGAPSREIAASYAGCDVLILETNHDLDMLRAGLYPASLKRRIAGTKGHLSNEQAAELLRLLAPSAPKVLVLAHLSQVNNRPRLARLAVERAFAHFDTRPRIVIAPQDRPTPPIHAEAGDVTVMASRGERQLSLSFAD